MPFYWGLMAMIMIGLGSTLLKVPPTHAANGKTAITYGTRDFTLGEMLGAKEAYLLFVIFFTACMSGLYLIGVVKDIGVEMAANAVSAIAIFNTVGRIVLGAMSDKVGRLRVVSGTLLVTALAVTVMAFLPLSPVLFFICVSAIAFCFGGNITVFPAIVGDFFGLKHHRKNYGVIYQGFGIGALSGSFIAARLGGFHATFNCDRSIVSAVTADCIVDQTAQARPHATRDACDSGACPRIIRCINDINALLRRAPGFLPGGFFMVQVHGYDSGAMTGRMAVQRVATGKVIAKCKVMSF